MNFNEFNERNFEQGTPILVSSTRHGSNVTHIGYLGKLYGADECFKIFRINRDGNFADFAFIKPESITNIQILIPQNDNN